jgi:hypothetical protein
LNGFATRPMVDAYSDAAKAATYSKRSVESARSAAVSRRSVYSMSSATRCNRDVGSLKDTGRVILVISLPIIDFRMLCSLCKQTNHHLKKGRLTQSEIFGLSSASIASFCRGPSS